MALRHHIEIEHACEKSCACTTCHVVVREGFDSLNESDELEDDMLDKAWGLERCDQIGEALALHHHMTLQGVGRALV